MSSVKLNIDYSNDSGYFYEASEALRKLDFIFRLDSLTIEVKWFRIMEKLESDWVIERHNHASYELHLIHKGACEVVLDDRSFIVRAGEFYLTNPLQYHEQRSVAGESLVEYCLNLNFIYADELDQEMIMMRQVYESSRCVNLKDTEGLMELFTACLIEAKIQKIGYFNLIKNQIYMMCVKMGRILATDMAPIYEVPKRYSTDDFRLKEIQQFIQDHCRQNLKTSDIADYLKLSEKQVCRIVKKQLNLTTKQLISQIRMQEAKRLLKTQMLTVKEVAYLMGFSSEYYFNQFFKELEGCPPGRYCEVF